MEDLFLHYRDGGSSEQDRISEHSEISEHDEIFKQDRTLEHDRIFEDSTSPGWPHLEIEVLNFRSPQYVREMRDVFAILSKQERLKPQLNQISLDGDRNKNLRQDIKWRADHLGTTANYWDLVESDVPWQLSEGIALDNQTAPNMGVKPSGFNFERQALSKHPFFRNADLVRNLFRCFHRPDGSISPLVLIGRC